MVIFANPIIISDIILCGMINVLCVPPIHFTIVHYNVLSSQAKKKPIIIMSTKNELIIQLMIRYF